ncbi:hypothetical protein [Fulvivirga lutimaris]|uniref:hypothetical protein n=1 Tax=Fulvivirga lutimaris TaxID=1819566 RepID=UPI0012BCF2AD|nr:hypothetical protein [Fulvivirga lutimaris]MTI38435.1 hypothetical protein [Fulvivirga lutimaris]
MKASLTEFYFSETMKWMSSIALIAGNVVLIIYAGYGFLITISLLFIPFLFTSKYEISIDKNESVVDDSFSTMGIKIKSDKQEFKELKGIRIDKEKHSYTANTRSRVRQVNFNEYIATLEYDDDKELELSRNSDYDDFSSQVYYFAEQLELNIRKTF